MTFTYVMLGLIASFLRNRVVVGFQSAPTSRTARELLSAQTHTHAHATTPHDPSVMELDRRSAISLGIFGSTLIGRSDRARSVDEGEGVTSPPITNTVFFKVRISRQDGTFYVRDDLEDTPENRVFTGTLELGLFGTVAPRAVQQFLKYVNITYNPLDDNPLPSYSRSTFASLDQATGLLTGGSIPSLEVTTFAGSTAIQYGGRILVAPLWVEPGMPTNTLKHSSKGLLTHRILEVAPTFGITTRTLTPELDGTNIVFGKVLFDDSSREFFRLVEDLPTYNMELTSADPSGDNLADTAKSALFNSQREIFRSVAKGIGDSRVGKVYEGKLLRRVEVTQVGLR